MSNEPPMIIELVGPQPGSGRQWCATCCVLYMGEVSGDEENQLAAQALVKAAEEAGEKEVEFLLPQVWHKKIRFAVTTAPSVYYPTVPMPVCWSHIVGMAPGAVPEKRVNRLIAGKDYRSERRHN